MMRPLEKTRPGKAAVLSPELAALDRVHRHSPAAVAAFGEDLKILFCNPAFEHAYGFVGGAAAGASVLALHDESNQRWFLDEVMATVKRGKAWTGETTRCRRNGESFPAVLTVFSVAADDGTFLFFVETSHDLTHQIAFRRKLELQHAVLEQIPDHVIAFDTNGIILHVNRSVLASMGRPAEEIVGHHVSKVLGERTESGEQVTEVIEFVRRDGRWSGMMSIPGADGRQGRFHVKLSSPREGPGSSTFFVAVGFAVVGEQVFRDSLKGAQSLGEIFEFSPDGVALTDPAGRILQVNDSFRRITGRLDAELIGRPECELSPESWKDEIEANRVLLLSRGHTSYEKEYRRPDGRLVSVYVTSCLVRDEAGALKNVGLLVRDITEVKASETRLRQMANTDALTGIFNRRHFLEEADREFARSRRYTQNLSCLMLDLDHFKDVNDRFGHDAGDDVLVGMVNLCRAGLRGADMIGRLGGEEFCIMLPETPLAGAIRVAERIRKTVEFARIETCSGRISLTVSMGVAQLEHERHRDLKDLIRCADQALLEAKNRGRNRVAVCGASNVDG